jgi:quercetin dioxygenase-like cupin family protein
MNVPVPVSVIEALEAEGLKHPQVEVKCRHYLAQGAYAREVTLPAGCIFTGRVHKQSQINILSQGRLKVTTEYGVAEVEAPFTIVSPPGTKRAVYTLTECVWTTILGTHLTDPEVIHDTLTCATEQEYLDYTRYVPWRS